MADADVYKNIVSDLIKKQMIILGPDIALSTAQKVQGLTIDKDGNVTEISGDPKAIMEGVTSEYIKFSGEIAQTTLNAVLEKYPEIEQ